MKLLHRFGEHKGSYCTVVKLSDGRQENYVNSINIDELEQQCLEHQKVTTGNFCLTHLYLITILSCPTH